MSKFNQSYWDRFYSHNEHIPTTPTTFAQLVLPWIESNLSTCSLVELGCGNGRDALWFAARGVQRVVALDLSHASIARLQAAIDQSHSHSDSGASNAGLADHVTFVEADFSNLPTNVQEPPLSIPSVTMVYSRFTLHAIDAQAQARALRWSWNALSKGGLLAIEVRSVLGSLYGKGTPVEGERDAFVHGHYRRFLRHDEILAELREIGFDVAYEDERSGVAVFGDDDPVVLRIIARKP